MTQPTILSQFKNIAIVGAGQMGGGIAQVFAAAGVDTYLFDAVSAQVERGIKAINDRLDRGVEKGKLTAEQTQSTRAHLHSARSLAELSQVDLVIEAIVENFAAKEQLFREFDKLAKKSTIFATNTSSISITKLAACVSRPEQVVGMHFMNPVPVMKLVELIRGLQTSDATYESTKALVIALDKTPVTARFDYPGFIVNRILVPMLNEAVYALMEGIATPEEIDSAMKLGTNQPMGPLELADFVGLDTCLSILRILHNELGDDKYRPCPLLVKYVEAGWYGKKTGRGFYTYPQ